MFKFESQGAVEVIAPEASLDLDNADKLVEAIAKKTFAGQPMVVLDMSNVPLVDSAALEALLDIQKMLRESSGTLKLAGLSQLCTDVFKMTGLVERFETFKDAKTAVGSFVR